MGENNSSAGIGHLLQQLTASGLAVVQATTKEPIKEVKECDSPLKVLPKYEDKSSYDDMSNLVEEVKSQPYYKMFINALKKEGIKTNENLTPHNKIGENYKPAPIEIKLENDKEMSIEKKDLVVANNSSRREGLRRQPQVKKKIDEDLTFVKEGKRKRTYKKKGKRGRPKIKKLQKHVNENEKEMETEENVKHCSLKMKKKTRQPKDEIKAIEKDATKELMEALMRSAILKGKVATFQPTVKTDNSNSKNVPSLKKKDSSKCENDNEYLESEIPKSDHTPRYKYLTGFEDRPHSCPYCQGCFTKKSYLKQHIRTHTGEKPHECDICNRRFRQQAALKRHIMTHTGEKPFKCTQCSKCYSDKAVLNEHMRVHTGEKPFLCHICTKSFAYTFSFKQHMKRHRGERDHPCDLCDAKFYTASSLATHIKKSHTGIRDAICDLCGKAFVDKSDVTRHRRKIHFNGTNNQKNSTNPQQSSSSNNAVAAAASFSRTSAASDQFSLMGAFTQHLMGAASGDPNQASLQNTPVWGPGAPTHTPFPPTNIPWGGSTMWGQGNFGGYRP